MRHTDRFWRTVADVLSVPARRFPAWFSVIGAVASLLAIGVFVVSTLSESTASVAAAFVGILASLVAGIGAGTIARTARRLSRKRIYVSYTTADNKVAEDLVRVLSREGMHVRHDPKAIHAGDSIREAIHSAIDSADVMIVLFSSATEHSKWQELELRYALEHEKRIIPVLLEKVTLPELVQDLRYIDFARNREEVVRELLDAVEYQAGRRRRSANP